MWWIISHGVGLGVFLKVDEPSWGGGTFKGGRALIRFVFLSSHPVKEGGSF